MNETQRPPPMALALIVCDSVYVDPSTQKKTLLGIFHAVSSDTFPVRLAQVVAYGAITDGYGECQMRLRLVDCNEERDPIVELVSPFTFTDPRVVGEAMWAMRDVVFPGPGEYRLQLLSGDDLLIERRIVVMPLPGVVDEQGQ